jgi:uncharacterized membrane protein
MPSRFCVSEGAAATRGTRTTSPSIKLAIKIAFLFIDFHLQFSLKYLLGCGWFRCWLKRNVSKCETAYKASETYISGRGTMQKALLALVIILLSVSIVGLVLFATANFGGGNGRGHGANSGGMMDGMIGDSSVVWLLVFVVPLVVALAIIVYMVAFPKIKQAKTVSETAETVSQAPQSKQTLDAVLKVLNEDERKVVETLASAKEGRLLQKEIRWKTNLSRVKVHRVVARLAERGIVQVEKQDNTNKVTLSEWITKPENNP